jgi:hypothetical protein
MKNNKYYVKLQKDVIKRKKKADIYIYTRRAKGFKEFHERIRDKKGMFKILDNLVCRANELYYRRAKDIYVLDFMKCIDEIEYLSNILKKA